jgi:hypothetical protein
MNSSAAAQPLLAAPTMLVFLKSARKGCFQISRRASPANRRQNDTVQYDNTINTSVTNVARAVRARTLAQSSQTLRMSDLRRKIVSPHDRRG